MTYLSIGIAGLGLCMESWHASYCEFWATSPRSRSPLNTGQPAAIPLLLCSITSIQALPCSSTQPTVGTLYGEAKAVKDTSAAERSAVMEVWLSPLGIPLCYMCINTERQHI